MAKWIVRDQTTSVQTGPERDSVIFRLRRSLSVKPEDSFILLSSEMTERTFTHEALVTGVEQVKEEEEVRVFRVTIDKWKTLERQLPLDDFYYSLTIVRNLKKPYLHFRQGYRRIPEGDYQSIVHGEPFLARTLFLELLLALPDMLRRQFTIEGDLFLDLEGENSLFLNRLTRLLAFVNERVLTVGSQLLEIRATWEAISSSGANEGGVEPYFDDEEASHGAVNILRQAQLFQQLQTELALPEEEQIARGVNLFGLALQEINEPDRNAIETRFEDLFATLR